MSDLKLLAFDLGASNGRAMLGRFDGKRIRVSELSRFENDYTELGGVMYWDILRLFSCLKDGFKAYSALGEGALDCFGIDSWGVDYGLIDANGALLGMPRAYRYASEENMNDALRLVSKRELFDSTGAATQVFNTVFQLYDRAAEHDGALAAAHDMLMIPDLLGYFFSGEKASEYTNVSTTMLYDPVKRDWAWSVIDRLGIPRSIFTKIDIAGTLRGRLRESIAEETGAGRARFAAVGTHDTASAVAAIPGEGSFAFCSSGTWSLFGVETDKPVLNQKLYESGFSNEGTVQGGFRPLKNIMGLWIIQECRREWKSEGLELSWDDIVRAAEAEQPYASVIDPDRAEFFYRGSMRKKIADYCARTGQRVPESVGQIARTVYESLALKYRMAVEDLEEIKGAHIDALNIVGGGIQNRLLNRLAAEAVGRPVITGPVEGAAMGNLLMQAVALGELKDISEVREVVRASIDTEIYEPVRSERCEEAYSRLKAYMSRED